MSTRNQDVDAAELKDRMDRGGVLLVDVRLDEEHAAGHLPGAWGNCVLEVQFPERMREKLGDVGAAVCVYGSAASQESRLAVEKLGRAGYREVSRLKGGVEGWVAAGFPLETTGGGALPRAAAARTPADGRHRVDTGESRLRWTGRNLLNAHHGTLALTAGEVTVADGRVTAGRFVIDMRSMRCTDLAGAPEHDVLIGHLQDIDFFDVEKHPEAVFEITGSEAIAGATPGAPDVRLRGTLTLRGKSAPVELEACSGMTADGRAAAQASVTIDRTIWGALYGSGKWYRRLGGHLVNDRVEVAVSVVCEKRTSETER